MRSMRGQSAGAPSSTFIQWMFLFLLGIFFIFIMVQWVSASEAALKNVEESTVIYTISSVINGFSVAEKGKMSIDLKDVYDIRIDCKDTCSMTALPHGEEKDEDDKGLLIIGNIDKKSIDLTKVKRICIEKGYKDPKDKVVISVC